MKQQSLMLNIVPFTSPVSEVTLPFSVGKEQGYFGLYLDDEVKALVGNKMTNLEYIENKRIYTDFGTPKENSFLLTFDIAKQPHLALHYFKHLVYTYFRNGVAHIMQRNFTDDIEVWFLNTEEQRDEYNLYDKFTLKVNHCNFTEGIELVVSYDSTSRVSKKSLKQMAGFDTSKLQWKQ